MKYYVIADIHGFYTYMKDALKAAGFFEETEPHKLIVCGDLLDRGAEAERVVDFMIDLMEEDRLIYILGNHEELLIQCMQEISEGNTYEIACGMSHHYSNMTWDTLLQIADMTGIQALENDRELLHRVINSPLYKKLLPSCVDYHETPNYVFVHGWIPCHAEGPRYSAKYTYDPNWRDADEGWYYARWHNGMELACKHGILEPDKTIVCGHWHTSYGHAKIEGKGSERGADADFSPFYAKGIIALDACAAASGRLNCIVIED